MMDLDVYDVSYKTVVKGVPAWATTEDAKRHFPKLAELIGDGDGKAKAIRTHDGWRSAYELEAEISVAAKGGQNTQLAEMYRKQMQRGMDAATLSLDEAKDLVAKQIAEPEWTSRSGVACLPLNVQRGGDEKDAQSARDAAEFAITYYDRNDRKPYEYQTMARNLHILAALEGAGLAEMEAIRLAPPPQPAKIGRKQPMQPIEPPKPLGIRYKVSKEAMTAMGMSGYGGGCIPAGRTKIEVLALQENYDYGQTSVQARATVDQTPEWALKIAEGLPALKTILENGLAMQGSLHRMPEGSAEAGKWKLSGLTPIYPTLSYDSIPAHLKPVMPLTVAVIAAIVFVSVWTPLLHDAIAARWFSWPNLLYLSPVPVLVALDVVLLARAVARRRAVQPFVLALGLFLLSYLGLGISLFPNIIPPSVSIWDAAAPDESLVFLLVGALVLLPIILGYTAYAYWVFRGKVGTDEGYH